ncbi:MAG: ABC transporter permease [Roseivirga sp.]
MLKNFLLISYRNIRRNKGASLLNIFSLAMGMATCLFIFNYVYYELSFERFHKRSGEVYRIETNTYELNDIKTRNAFSTYATAPKLTSQFDEITTFTRLVPYSENGSAFFGLPRRSSTDKKVFIPLAYFAEPSILDLFSVNILAGNPLSCLIEPNSLVLSTSMIRKIFGKEGDYNQFIGTKLKPTNLDIATPDFTITAIFEDLPANTHLSFDALASLSSSAENISLSRGENTYGYVLIPEGAARDINTQLANKGVAASADGTLEKQLSLKPIRDIHLASKISNEPGTNANKLFLTFLSVIGLIILTLACTNFVNNAIINSIDRAREVGIRKLAGILPHQLLSTLLAESFLINAFAGLIGLIIFALGLKSLLTFTDITYPITLSISTVLVSFFFLIALIIISTLLSGIYPATLLISLKPVEALKGKAQVVNSKQSTRGSKVMRVLLIFQLCMSIIFISAVYVVQEQLAFMRKNDRQPFELKVTAKFGGLAGVNDIYARQSARFLSQVDQNSSTDVLSVTNLYNGHINYIREIKALYQSGVDTAGVEEPFLLHLIDYSYWQDAPDIFLSGENFSREFGIDYNGIIINESALKAMKFNTPEEAIGKSLSRYNGYQFVKGVVKNDKPNDRPKVYVTGYRYPTYFNLSLRTLGSSAESINGTLFTTQGQWEGQFPWLYFIDRKFENQSAMEQNLLKMFFIFTFLAVSIACLGIFGLSSFTAIKRTKEIGIRKILGARVAHILMILVYDFLQLMFYGSVVAIPIVILGAREWLTNYAVRIYLNPLFVVVPILIMSAIAITIIIKQCWRTSVLNPIQALAQQ